MIAEEVGGWCIMFVFVFVIAFVFVFVLLGHTQMLLPWAPSIQDRSYALSGQIFRQHRDPYSDD